jgi:hypothetical protein
VHPPARLPAADGRAALLSLTIPGVKAVEEMRRRLADAFDAYLVTWPPDEARTFATALRRFAEHGPFLAAAHNANDKGGL